jgi:hypothetical protein
MRLKCGNYVVMIFLSAVVPEIMKAVETCVDIGLLG